MRRRAAVALVIPLAAAAGGRGRRWPPPRAAGTPRAWRRPDAQERSGDSRLPAEWRIRLAGWISLACLGDLPRPAGVPRARQPIPASREGRTSTRSLRSGRPVRGCGGAFSPGHHGLSGGLRLTDDLRVSARGGPTGRGPGRSSRGAAPPERRRVRDGTLRASGRRSRDPSCVGVGSPPAAGASRRGTARARRAAGRAGARVGSDHGLSMDRRGRHDVRDESSRPSPAAVSLAGGSDALTGGAPRRIVGSRA